MESVQYNVHVVSSLPIKSAFAYKLQGPSCP